MKNWIVFLFCLLLIAAQHLHAQNLNGFKIYVSKRRLTTLYFHDKVTNNHFGEKSYPYTIEALARNEKTVPLSVTKDVKDPYTLYVTEGSRTHKFIVIYKDYLDKSEQDVYFDDLKQLTKLSKDLNAQPAEVPQANNSSITQQAINSPPRQGKDNANIYELLDSADKERENQQLDLARDKYEQVLKQQPDNNYAQTQLATVKKMVENRDSQKYEQMIKNANNAFAENRLDESLRYYTSALNMKPDDIYLNSQIELIRATLARAKIAEAQRQNDSLFQSYIYAGDKSLADKSYEPAKVAYRQALQIKPNNVIATSKLNSVDQKILTDSLDSAKQRTNDLYTSYVTAGDKAMDEKAYPAARAAYNEALTVKPNDATVMAKLKTIDQKIVADSIETNYKKNEQLYTAYISLADKAFKEQSYDEARDNYNGALQVKPGDIYATGQVGKINNALAEMQRQAERDLALQKNQEREAQYKLIISLADQYYNSGMYQEAKEQYAKALDLNKTDVYSKSKVAQINKTLAAQKEKIRQDSINEVKYTEAIVKADNAFDKQDYNNAKPLYTTALKIKSDDPYARERLNAIETAIVALAAKKQAQKDSILKENEAIKKYNGLLTNAKTAYSANDYTTAKVMYAAAIELRPKEAGPREKLTEIENKLSAIAEAKARAERLDSLMSMADIALANQQLSAALENYKEASGLNPPPDELYYMQKQIHYIDYELIRQDALAKQQQQEQEGRKKLETAMDAYRQGKEALKYLKYEEALFDFKQFLSLADSSVFAASEYDLELMSKFANTKVQDIESYLARQNIKPAVIDSSKIVASRNEQYTTILFYPNPKDPALDRIYAKYPDINFNMSPYDQRFDSLADYTVESRLISREVMSLKPELNLTDSSNQVRLICQNIEFKESKVYFKLLIQNYDSTEFLAGKMLLTYHKKDGSEMEVLPNYVANFPIVLAGRQKVVVYLAKLVPVSNDESLTFRMSDRLNKVSLSVFIPGEIYNQKQVALNKH